MAETVRVWDPLVRIVHWILVAAFAVAWLSAEELSTLHEISGYVVAGLVAFRLAWGLVGGHYARFSQSEGAGGHTCLSARHDERAGAALSRPQPGRRRDDRGDACGLVGNCLYRLASGRAGPRGDAAKEMPQIVAPAQADEDGGEYGERGKDEGALKDIHGALANLMLLLAGLHVGGVVLASVRHHEKFCSSHGHWRQAPPRSRRHRLTFRNPEADRPFGHLAPPSPAGPFILTAS